MYTWELNMLDTRHEPLAATKECSMIYTNRSECVSLKPDTRTKEQKIWNNFPDLIHTFAFVIRKVHTNVFRD